jgi:hypothetical protein
VYELPNTPDTIEIIKNDVVLKAAVLPSGSQRYLSVLDYCPQNDNINEIRVGWSETDSGQAEFATITFPSGSFGDGPKKVEVKACHWNRLSLKAYDKNGNLVDSAEHSAGQGIIQTLTLSDGRIRRIDIIGAEIGIRDVCYRKY